MQRAYVLIAFRSRPSPGVLDETRRAVENRLLAISRRTPTIVRGPDYLLAYEEPGAKAWIGTAGRHVILCDGWVGSAVSDGALLTALHGDSRAALSAVVPQGNYTLASVHTKEDGSWASVAAMRDHVGGCPLYSSFTDELFALSNFPALLAAIPAVGSEINAGFAAEYLAAEFNSVHETLYRNVTRVLGGHRVRFDRTDRTPRFQRYWCPRATVERRSPADARAEFGSLLDDAIVRTCSGTRRVTLAVSGGVDSSCLAVRLNRLLADGRLPGVDVSFVTVAFEDACSEAPYIEALRSAIAFPILPIKPRYATVEELDELMYRLRYPAGTYVGSTMSRISEHVVSAGGGLMLNGEGGDELLVPYATALWQAAGNPRDWGAVGQFIRVRAKSAPESMSLRGRLRHIAAPWLGWSVENVLRRHRDRQRSGWRSPVDAAWAHHANLSRRLDSLVPPDGCRTLAMALAQSGFWSEGQEAAYFQAYADGVERRSPLMDARLLQYCNTLALDLLDGQSLVSRRLMRDTCSELPKLIARRVGKAEFSTAVSPPLAEVAIARFGRDWNCPRADPFGQIVLGAKEPMHVWRLDAACSFAALIAVRSIDDPTKSNVKG